MQYLHDNDALLVFYLEDAKWTKKICQFIFSIKISTLVVNFGLAKSHFVQPILVIQTNWLVSQFFYSLFFLICMNYILFCLHHILLIFHFTFFSFVLQIVKFTTLLFVRSFSNAYGLTCMPLPLQMNIDKGLLENIVDLDDNVLKQLHICYFSTYER